MNFKSDSAYQSRKQTTLDLVSNYQLYAKASWSSQSKLHSHQLNNLISHAIKSSWWRDRLAKSNLNSSDSFLTMLNKIPVLTRSDLQQFGLWMTIWLPNSKPEDYETTKTSGSTGKPIQVIKYRNGSVREHRALQLLDAIWQKRDMTKPFLQLRANTENFDTANQIEPFCYLAPTGMSYGRKLTEISLQETLVFLAEKNIGNFLVNPLALKLIAKEQIRTQIPGIKVDQVVSWGDKLDQEARNLAFNAFGARVCDRYSAEELGYLAMQCPDSEHLHTLPFFNFVQILNRDNKPCQVGELGRVVVTNWHSFGQPLIRYELGDLASWGEPCKFGITMPVLEPTIVRVRDVDVNEQGKISIPRLDKTALSRIASVADYQVAHFTDGIVALVRTYADLSDSELHEIKTDLAVEFPTLNRIEILQGQDIDWLALWKRNLIVKFDQPIPEDFSLPIIKVLLLPNSNGQN